MWLQECHEGIRDILRSTGQTANQAKIVNKNILLLYSDFTKLYLRTYLVTFMAAAMGQTDLLHQ